MSTALYVLAQEYRQTADTLVDLGIDEQAITDTLESISDALTAKVQNIACVVRNLDGLAEQIKAAEQQMSERRQAIERRAARIRDYLLTHLLAADIRSLECPYFKIAVRDNPPSVVIDDARAIPDAYLTDPLPPPPAPDKQLIKQAIQDGFDVPGAHLTHGKRLEIK